METGTGITSTVTGYPDTTYAQVEPGCPYCGFSHQGVCPRVEEMEYHPDGTLKRVKFRLVAHPLPTKVEDLVGHTCGEDCSLPTYRDY